MINQANLSLDNILNPDTCFMVTIIMMFYYKKCIVMMEFKLKKALKKLILK